MFRPVPEILLPGAMRGGTTFLYHALSAHPLIAPPRTKETQFFSFRWAEGKAAYRRQLPRRWPRWAYSIVGRRRPCSIDSSPHYLSHPHAPSRVRELLGTSVRVIVLLREPGERAWSHYRLNRARGHEHLGFLDAIAEEENRLAGEAERIAAGGEAAGGPHQIFSYVARGRYAEQLQRWWRVIPREQFLLLRSESLFSDPQGTFDRVCLFLKLPAVRLPEGLPPNAAPPFSLPHSARKELDRIFEAPNRALFDLAGIDFGRTALSGLTVSGAGARIATHRTPADYCIPQDPCSAPGEALRESGNLQFDYLINEGLRPDHTMLDIGCGTLRSGRHFIAYLERGKYSGLDISPIALAYGSQLVVREGLSRKQPVFVLDVDLKPGFQEFNSRFDVLLAQSVFTHLPEPQIAEFFAHAGRIMHAGSRLYFTFFPSSTPSQLGRGQFGYPFAFFEGLAGKHGFEVELRDNYAHPKGQRMAVLRVPEPAPARADALTHSHK